LRISFAKFYKRVKRPANYIVCHRNQTPRTNKLTKKRHFLTRIFKTKFAAIGRNLVTKIITERFISRVNNGQARKSDIATRTQAIANELSFTFWTRKASGKLLNRDHIIPVAQILKCFSGCIVEFNDWRRIFQQGAQLAILDLKLRYTLMRERKLIRENAKLRRLQIKQILFDASSGSDADNVFSDFKRIHNDMGNSCPQSDTKNQSASSGETEIAAQGMETKTDS